jgi:hypothetical protein
MESEGGIELDGVEMGEVGKRLVGGLVKKGVIR